MASGFSFQLQDYKTFEGLSPTELVAAETFWEARELAAGQTLWEHGAPASEMGLLIEGELTVSLGGVELATVRPETLVGEVGAWTGDSRSASLIASAPSRLLILNQRGLRSLRAWPSIYLRLLDLALVRSARSVDELDRQIAREASGSVDAPAARTRNLLQSWWDKIAGGPKTSPPMLSSLLRRIPALRKASSEQLSQLSSCFQPVYVEPGFPLFLQGDEGDSAYLVGEGCIEVVRHVRSRKGEVLAELFPGTLLGTGSMILSLRRNASCIAPDSTPCWLFELKRETFQSAEGEAGIFLREIFLESLHFQLTRADEHLARLRSGERIQFSDYERGRQQREEERRASRDERS